MFYYIYMCVCVCVCVCVCTYVCIYKVQIQQEKNSKQKYKIQKVGHTVMKFQPTNHQQFISYFALKRILDFSLAI